MVADQMITGEGYAEVLWSDDQRSVTGSHSFAVAIALYPFRRKLPQTKKTPQ